MKGELGANSRRDRTGILIAALCLVHCVCWPGIITVTGMASRVGISERLEPLFLFGSFMMGTLALLPGYRRNHRRPSCLAMFCCGILCLSLRHQIRWTYLMNPLELALERFSSLEPMP
jgi:hypothetical protein